MGLRRSRREQAERLAQIEAAESQRLWHALQEACELLRVRPMAGRFTLYDHAVDNFLSQHYLPPARELHRPTGGP